MKKQTISIQEWDEMAVVHYSKNWQDTLERVFYEFSQRKRYNLAMEDLELILKIFSWHLSIPVEAVTPHQVKLIETNLRLAIGSENRSRDKERERLYRSLWGIS